MNKKISFHRNFRGLQLIWAHEGKPDELEFICFDALLSLTNRFKTIHTTSYFLDEVRELNCDYRPKAVRRENTIQIHYYSYSGAQFDCAPGITTIEFTSSKLTTIKNLSWTNHENSSLRLIEHKYNTKVNKRSIVRGKGTNSSNGWDRSEQAKLKSEILAIDTKCLLSNCDLAQTLQAAHIRPVSQKGTDFPDNAILLRADLHILFDQGLISIDPITGKVLYDPSIKKYAATQKLRSSIDKKILKRIHSSLKWRQKYY